MLTRALSDLIKLSRRSGKPDATVDRLAEIPTGQELTRESGWPAFRQLPR
jgi:hypothetical protein